MTVIIAVAMSCVLSSCGNKHESTLKQQINLMNDYADEFEKDPKSDKLAKIDEKLREVAEKMSSLKELPESEAKKLMTEYAGELSAASARYLKARTGTAIGDIGKMLEGIDIEKAIDMDKILGK